MPAVLPRVTLCALVSLSIFTAVNPAAAEPAVEPGWVVFSSARTGDGDIYGIDPETSASKLLVGSPAGEGGARYDAARDRLVYVRYEDDAALLVANDELLFADPTGDNPPVWSPDGLWIAYATRRDGREDIYLAKADGSDTRALTADDERDRYPAWSPDSQRLVFARRLDTGWDLHTIDIGEKNPQPKRITQDGVYVGHPAWSPDGGSIAFDAQFGDQTEIVILDLETKSKVRLTDRAGNDLVPAWSLDGTHIAFGADSGDGNWELWSVDVKSKNVTRLTDSPGFDGAPVFVPQSALPK